MSTDMFSFCRRPSVRRWSAFAAVFFVVAGIAALTSATGDAQAASGEVSLETLGTEVEVLERQVKLASGKGFYLILDEEASELRLLFGGALLQQFPVSSIEVGYPRLAFRRVGEVPSWSSAIWSDGTLAPGRAVETTVLQPPAAGAEDGPETPVPPTAEEAIPVPQRYRLRFAGGLALEIVRPDDSSVGYVASRLRLLQRHWNDVRSVMSQSTLDAVRIRLVLDRAVAEAFYRSVPANVGLMIGPERSSS